VLQGMQDNDDYFHEDPKQLCIPDIPDDLNTESDSIDLDDVPCRVEELLPEPSTPASMSAPASTSAPDQSGEMRAAAAAAAAAAPISRSEFVLIFTGVFICVEFQSPGCMCTRHADSGSVKWVAWQSLRKT
jgi:hypothetical protein